MLNYKFTFTKQSNVLVIQNILSTIRIIWCLICAQQSSRATRNLCICLPTSGESPWNCPWTNLLQQISPKPIARFCRCAYVRVLYVFPSFVFRQLCCAYFVYIYRIHLLLCKLARIVSQCVDRILFKILKQLQSNCASLVFLPLVVDLRFQGQTFHISLN